MKLYAVIEKIPVTWEEPRLRRVLGLFPTREAAEDYADYVLAIRCDSLVAPVTMDEIIDRDGDWLIH